MRGEIARSYFKLITTMYSRIDGVLVEKKGGGYVWRGDFYENRAAVQEAIKISANELGNTINKK